MAAGSFSRILNMKESVRMNLQPLQLVKSFIEFGAYPEPGSALFHDSDEELNSAVDHFEPYALVVAVYHAALFACKIHS